MQKSTAMIGGASTFSERHGYCCSAPSMRHKERLRLIKLPACMLARHVWATDCGAED